MYAFEQKAAFFVVEVDDFDAVLAQPVEAASEGAAFAHDQRADAELAHQAAAIPAWSQCGDHDFVAVAALPAGAAKGVSLGVNAGVALLHAAIMTLAEQRSPVRAKSAAPMGIPPSARP